MAQWAQAMPLLCPRLCPGPPATSTCPLELGKCFPSGVSMVPGQPELLCSPWPLPPGPWPGPGSGEGGEPLWPEQRGPGVAGKRASLAGGLRGSG